MTEVEQRIDRDELDWKGIGQIAGRGIDRVEEVPERLGVDRENRAFIAAGDGMARPVDLTHWVEHDAVRRGGDRAPADALLEDASTDEDYGVLEVLFLGAWAGGACAAAKVSDGDAVLVVEKREHMVARHGVS